MTSIDLIIEEYDDESEMQDLISSCGYLPPYPNKNLRQAETTGNYVLILCKEVPVSHSCGFSMVEWLRYQGHFVQIVNRCEDALDLLLSIRVDVFFVDITMVRMIFLIDLPFIMCLCFFR